MNITRILAVSAISGLLAAPVFAEPSWWLNRFHQSDVERQPAETYQVGKVSGMDKYLPHSKRFTEVTVDTEIAAFEEVSEKATYRKAVRMDRIPSL